MPNHSCPCCDFLPNDLFLPPNEKAGPLPAEVLSPQEAYQELLQNQVHELFDTHSHVHLKRNNEDDPSSNNSIYRIHDENPIQMYSLVCAVEEKDWNSCLEFASTLNRRAALGIHPWYLENLDPNYTSRMREILITHPRVMVGEIGLCKMARFVRQHPDRNFATQLQRDVFREQLQIAIELQRPVSIHCVQQHGILLEILKEHRRLPPALALHSFSGTAHQVNQLLEQVTASPIFFGISHAVNVAMNTTSKKSRKQTIEAIRAIPSDRLLVESDVHRPEDEVGGTVGALAFVAWAREETLLSVVEQCNRNARRFLDAFGDDVKGEEVQV